MESAEAQQAMEQFDQVPPAPSDLKRADIPPHNWLDADLTSQHVPVGWRARLSFFSLALAPLGFSSFDAVGVMLCHPQAVRLLQSPDTSPALQAQVRTNHARKHHPRTTHPALPHRHHITPYQQPRTSNTDRSRPTLISTPSPPSGANQPGYGSRPDHSQRSVRRYILCHNRARAARGPGASSKCWI